MSSGPWSRANYAALYEAIPDAIFTIDSHGCISAMNHLAEVISGYSRKELIGRPVNVLIPEADRSLYSRQRNAFWARLTNREMERTEIPPHIKLRQKGGGEIRVDLRLSLVGKRGGAQVNCIVRDMSEHYARETRLRTHAEHQAALAEVGQRALSSADLQVILDDAVATLARVLGVEYSKVLRRLPDREELLLVSGVGWGEGLVGRVSVPTDERSQAGYTLASDEPVIVADLDDDARFDGPRLLTEHGVVSGMSVIIRGMHGPWGVLGVHTVQRRDFSSEEVQFLQSTANLMGLAIERERADEARRDSEDKLRASQRMEAIGRLAGGIAHDFNNLLLVIMNSAETLDGDGGNESAKAILSAAEGAASLTHQLMTFSRRQMLDPQILDINAEIAGMEETLRRMLGERVDLVTRLAPEVGRVRADPSQIYQVILNLAVNARDALPSGGRLEIATASAEIGDERPAEHASLTPGPHVAIRVSDTGEGMDAITRARAFEPFFTTKGNEGTGIGLATVYGIVMQSEGSIRISSGQQGRGTSIEILLPRVADPLDETDVRDEAAAATAGSEIILVVEDDPAVRDATCSGLRKRGYRVLEASGAAEALAISAGEAAPIDLVVTDMVMPGMRGDELIRELRSARRGVPVLVVSGYLSDSCDESLWREPDTSFLAKPFTSTRLDEKIREVLAS